MVISNLVISLVPYLPDCKGTYESDLGFDFAEIAGDVVSAIGTGVGSETTENVGIVVKLVGKLIRCTAFNAQHSKETFSLDKQFIYGLIYTVQNEQNLLKVPGVKQINMKRSEFLDAKHIRLVLFVCHKTSDVISDVHSSHFF